MCNTPMTQSIHFFFCCFFSSRSQKMIPALLLILYLYLSTFGPMFGWSEAPCKLFLPVCSTLRHKNFWPKGFSFSLSAWKLRVSNSWEFSLQLAHHLGVTSIFVFSLWVVLKLLNEIPLNPQHWYTRNDKKWENEEGNFA